MRPHPNDCGKACEAEGLAPGRTRADNLRRAIELFGASARRTGGTGRPKRAGLRHSSTFPRENPLMSRLALLGLALSFPLLASGQEPDTKQVAQDILNKGAALFDT